MTTILELSAVTSYCTNSYLLHSFAVFVLPKPASPLAPFFQVQRPEMTLNETLTEGGKDFNEVNPEILLSRYLRLQLLVPGLQEFLPVSVNLVGIISKSGVHTASL